MRPELDVDRIRRIAADQDPGVPVPPPLSQLQAQRIVALMEALPPARDSENQDDGSAGL